MATAGTPATNDPTNGGVVPVKDQILCMPRLPCCRCLDGTATEIGINTGSAAWRVKSPLSQYQQPAVPIPIIPGSWASLPPAVWIGAPGAPEAVGDYEFELQFYVPDCVIPAQIYATGQAAADNRAVIYMDSNTSPSGSVPGFDTNNITPFTAGPYVGAGIHRLRFVVTNDGGPTGLLVRGVIRIQCPREIEHGPRSQTGTAVPAPDPAHGDR